MAKSWVCAAWPWLFPAAAIAVSACGDDASPSATDSELTYCDVAPILAAKCARCHGDPTQHGAPFPLVTYADTQEPSPLPGDSERTRAADMLSAVESNYMPFMDSSLDPPVSQLTCEERSTLLGWLRKGAFPPPEGREDCRGVNPTLLSCGD
jgi:uncharacterized membrane protein